MNVISLYFERYNVTLSVQGVNTTTDQLLGSVELGPGGSYLLGIFPMDNGVN